MILLLEKKSTGPCDPAYMGFPLYFTENFRTHIRRAPGISYGTFILKRTTSGKIARPASDLKLLKNHRSKFRQI